MDTTHTSNALKCVQTSSATSTQTSTVFEAGSKSLSRTTTKKINPLGLDAFDTDAAALQIQMRHGSIDLQHLSKRLKRLAEWNCALRFHRWLPPQHLHTLDPSPPHKAIPMRPQIPLNFATIPISDHPKQEFQRLPYWSSNRACFRYSF